MRLTPSSGQMAGAQQRELVIVHGFFTLFLEVIALAIILLVVGLVVLRPCHCVDHNHGVDCLDNNSQVGNRCSHVDCFDGNRDICGNGAACSSIHGYVL
jgi:hypothetical protein